MDLNLDGNIDIITSWDSGFRGDLSDIWILSWNGTSGWFINEINEDIKPIHATYLIFTVAAKSEPRKIWP